MQLLQNLRPQVIPAFSVPIITFELPDAADLNRQFKTRILKRRERDPGILRSNINGWHSSEDFVNWGGEELQALANAFSAVCNGLTQFASPAAQWRIQSWANVSQRGHSNGMHFHPGAYWSATYYVDDGRREPDQDVGGEFDVRAPHENVSTMYAPDVFVRLPNNQPMSPILTIEPRPGLGVVFPSWLMHEVRPYRGDDTRISIAFNFCLAPSADRDQETRANQGANR